MNNIRYIINDILNFFKKNEIKLGYDMCKYLFTIYCLLII